jgi:phosphopantetheine--protein transferase-like protein
MNENITLFGIGVDIEDISKFQDIAGGQDKTFLNKVFSAHEIEYCFSYTDYASHFAARYCAKEAVVKALSGLINRSPGYAEIEILDGGNGRPLVKLKSRYYDSIQIYVSLSHCDDKAVAFALAIKTSADVLI